MPKATKKDKISKNICAIIRRLQLACELVDDGELPAAKRELARAGELLQATKRRLREGALAQ